MEDTVPLHDVIYVLKAHDVTVTLKGGTTKTYIVGGREMLEEIVLEDRVARQRLHYFARRLKFSVHLFWHPESAPPVKAELKQ